MREYKISRMLVILSVFGGLVVCLSFMAIQSGLQPCGSLDELLKPGRCIRKLAEERSVQTMSFAPDGTILATLSVDNTIHLWNMNDGQLLHTLKRIDIGTVNDMAFTPDGSELAIVFYNKIEFWQANDGLLLKEWYEDASFFPVAFTPDWSLLASGSPGGKIKLMHINNNGVIPFRVLDSDMHRVQESVLKIAFSPDGSILASGTTDNLVRLWQVEDGTLLHKLSGHTGSIDSLSFSPDGFIVASGGKEKILLWRVADGTFLHTLKGHKKRLLPFPTFITDTDFSPDGNILASGGSDNTMRLWRVSDGKLLGTIKHRNEVWDVEFSPDGTILASSEMRGPVRLFNVQQLLAESQE